MRSHPLTIVAALALTSCAELSAPAPAGVESSALGAKSGGPSVSAAYSIADLGTLGGTWSEASAINDNGEIVGTAATSSGQGRAFFRTAGGTMVDISPGRAEDVNDSRQLVGYAYDASVRARAFLWTVDANGAVASAIDLGPGVARAINKVGHMVGGDGALAIVWIAPAARLELPTLGGFSEAYDINDDDVIVGTSRHQHAGIDVEHAVRWRRVAADGPSSWVIETLEESEFTAAQAINSAGDVAGAGWPCGDFSAAACLGPRAYLWPAAGGRLELTTLGGIRRAALDLNDDGSAVGWSYDRTGRKKRPVAWPAAGGVADLGTSRKATGAEARAINASGEIVGWTEFIGGTKRATLWSPP